MLGDRSRMVSQEHRDESGQIIGYWLESAYGDSAYLTREEFSQLQAKLKRDESTADKQARH